MSESAKLFYRYFTDSIKEVKSNFKIYLVYVIALCLVSIVQAGLDMFYSKEDLGLRFFSKILFSIVPLLILSKILYVIKIRNFGLAEYGTVMKRFIVYNFYYFSLLMLSLLIYVSAAFFAGMLLNLQTQVRFLAASFLLAPFVYVIIFYSLTPFVAVFNDEDEPVFAKSKLLSSKKIFLVIINHLFSLIVSIVPASLIFINDSYIKFAVAFILSIPEAIFAILMILTTTKIYMYLTTRD